MTFHEDARIVDAALRRDPSFASVSPRLIARYRAMMWRAAGVASRDGFLLAAMRLMALAGNGHSRVIPNSAIEVLPLRVVARGAGWHVAGHGALSHVNGVAADALFRRLSPWMAGTEARRRAIAGPLFAWPAALALAGLRGDPVVYRLGAGAQLAFGRSAVVAAGMYPLPERGGDAPGGDPWPEPRGPDGPVWLRLAGFSDADVPDLEAVIARAAERVRAAEGPVVVDIRGNPGGSFLRAMPVVEALVRHGGRCAVLVDTYTFSAAIVFAVLVRHRLGDRAKLFGETMGDGLQFWAEGGTEPLPQSGAALRWSDGWHDWATGDPEGRGPGDLAPYMVAAGRVEIAPLRLMAGWLAG